MIDGKHMRTHYGLLFLNTFHSASMDWIMLKNHIQKNNNKGFNFTTTTKTTMITTTEK